MDRVCVSRTGAGESRGRSGTLGPRYVRVNHDPAGRHGSCPLRTLLRPFAAAIETPCTLAYKLSPQAAKAVELPCSGSSLTLQNPSAARSRDRSSRCWEIRPSQILSLQADWKDLLCGSASSPSWRPG